jgi:hypothetical protein
LCQLRGLPCTRRSPELNPIETAWFHSRGPKPKIAVIFGETKWRSLPNRPIRMKVAHLCDVHLHTINRSPWETVRKLAAKTESGHCFVVVVVVAVGSRSYVISRADAEGAAASTSRRHINIHATRVSVFPRFAARRRSTRYRACVCVEICMCVVLT